MQHTSPQKLIHHLRSIAASFQHSNSRPAFENMASTATEQLPAQTGREASGRRGAPRGRRGGDGASRGRGGGRGRGRGEGRGDRGDRADRHPRGAPAGNRVHDDKQRPEPQNRAPRVLPVSDSPALQTKPDADDAASDDSDVCFICADPIKYHSIAPCNHVTCHICSLRMRALYKTKACAHCRVRFPTYEHMIGYRV